MLKGTHCPKAYDQRRHATTKAFERMSKAGRGAPAAHDLNDSPENGLVNSDSRHLTADRLLFVTPRRDLRPH